MLDRIIKGALSHRILVIVASIVLFAAGLQTARQTEVDVFPDLNAPTVTVMTEAPGMAAEEVEKTVTFKIETAVNGATHVRRVRSSSSAGFSVVWVEFEWDTDIYIARQVVSEKIATVRGSLPDNVGEPTLGPQSSILGEVLIVGLQSDTTSLQELRTLADWTIRPRLLSTGGVAQVSVIGGDVREYQILVHPDKMRHLGVTLADVMEATRGMNVNQSGGVVYQYGNEYLVRGMAMTSDLDKLSSSVVLPGTDGRSVTLAQIADVTIGNHSPLTGVASERCHPAVLVTVTKQPHTGTRQLTSRLEAALEEIRPSLPADVKLSTDIFRQSRFIDNAIGNVQRSLYEGALFVVVILLLFLGDTRTTLISLVTIPLSLLVTVLILHVCGMGINTMSLGGMAIAIGSLVDDAIVDVENAWKRIRANRLLPPSERHSLVSVVYQASREVRLPILYSTLIVIVSFAPLFWLSGMEGKMLIPLGVSFIVSLCASTLVALTLTPVLCSYLPTRDKKQASGETWITRHTRQLYAKSLGWVLDHRHILFTATGLMVVSALAIAFNLGRSFLPSFNEGSLTINLAASPGISLLESDKIGRKAEELLLAIPEIQTVARKTGRAELDEHALGTNMSEIEAPFELDERSYSEFIADVRHQLGRFPGIAVEIGQPISHRIDRMLSGTKANIAIKVFGDDLGQLYNIGQEIKNAINDVEGIADLNVEQLVERPQLSIVPRHDKLAGYGMTVKELNDWIAVGLGGETVSQVYEGDRSFNLVVRASAAVHGTIEQIMDMSVTSGNGLTFPLSEIAEVKSASGANTINHENAKRRIVVSANANGRDQRSLVDEIQARISSQVVLPEGYHVEYGGQFESEAAAGRTLALASVLSIAIIYLLLFMLIGNATESAIVLVNLPLALVGGIWVLWTTTGEFSIPAIIGFISLFGIATRNGMLLISRYHELLTTRQQSVRECIIQGSIDRLNPILMTALTSALALVPMAIGGDLPGNEIQSPMAKVILGGLVTSTILNGYIVPSIQLWRMQQTADNQSKAKQK